MGYPALFSLLIVMFSLFSCGSSREQKADEPPAPDTLQQAAADTLPVPPPPGPAPAPGTIRLQTHLLPLHSGSADSGQAVQYRMKVLRVLGTGAGAPALVQGDTLQVMASANAPALTPGSTVTCTIKERTTLAQTGAPAAPWQLLRCTLHTDTQ